MSDHPEEAELNTVFGAPDQADIIARIDAVSDDDLSSSFFENSIQDVEDAAVRMFDVGVRTLTDDNVPLAAFGSQAGQPSPSSARPSSTSSAPQLAPGLEARFEDPAVRRAFILGGPQGLER